MEALLSRDPLSMFFFLKEGGVGDKPLFYNKINYNGTWHLWGSLQFLEFTQKYLG